MDDFKELKLSELKYIDSNELVINWELIRLDSLIVFYKIITNEKNENEPLGFYFSSCEICGGYEEYDKEEYLVEPLFSGVAYFDGIRHLFLGDQNQYDNFGYLNYPKVQNLINILSALKDLEKKYCSDI